MELFYAKYDGSGPVSLDADESGHCIKVLRHRRGDVINVIDGEGTLLRCRITDDNPRGAQAEVLERVDAFGALPYRLTLACCPTKNNDRFEWMVEKATEMGVDRIVPLIGERSERKVYKAERAQRIALSATKQSLKARIPLIEEPVSVKEFLRRPVSGTGLIAWCFEDDDARRLGIVDAVRRTPEAEFTVLIGPEGDFSPEEAALALAKGYTPVHLGSSRLRTETAALAAVAAVYMNYLDKAYVHED